jgi:hypothetical protein
LGSIQTRSLELEDATAGRCGERLRGQCFGEEVVNKPGSMFCTGRSAKKTVEMEFWHGNSSSLPSQAKVVKVIGHISYGKKIYLGWEKDGVCKINVVRTCSAL